MSPVVVDVVITVCYYYEQDGNTKKDDYLAGLQGLIKFVGKNRVKKKPQSPPNCP